MIFYANNMLHQELSSRGTQNILDLPSKLYIDMTPDCNLFCVMCRESIENHGRVMPIELFRRVVDETYEGVTGYSLVGSGESLLINDFKDRVEYLINHKLPNAKVELVTNGMLLKEEIIKFLIDHDIKVSVSFDGSNAKIFNNIRRGGNFDLICRNLERIANLAMKVSSLTAPSIGISIQQENWFDLVDIISLVNSLGVKCVGMWPVVNPDHCRLIIDKQKIEKITEAIFFADREGMAIDLFPIRLGKYIWNGDKYISTNGLLIDKRCDAPFMCSGVDWNGDVYLCCNYGSKVENIKGKNFREIWHGENYKALRNKVNDENDMPDRCKRCFWVNRY